eukprot:CAMPEP_0168860918 /NCGR_PEP_ID=MMETSP0727-20121128/17640_1 /TAXON_ID=265536 /ORGANISM="Amphiprora sp., Strain CCMP467" /LENGTH=944 /DNA_ID=CAMNT_0008915887 /DNA_START=148 /DNA_END=2978 /DNA_ORIENTATION=+
MKLVSVLALFLATIGIPTAVARLFDPDNGNDDNSNKNNQQSRRDLEARFYRTQRRTEVIEDEYIIEVAEGEQDTARTILEALLLNYNGSKILYEYKPTGFTVQGVPESEMFTLLDTYGSVFLTIEEDTRVKPVAVSSWGLDRIDQENLPLNNQYNLPNGLDGSGVDVYVIDSGIRCSHNDFGGRVKGGIDLSGAGLCFPQQGHGTHVAGTCCGNTYGVAPGADIYDVRVFDDTDDGAFTSTVIAGIRWVIEQHDSSKKSVINMSLGGSKSNAENAAVRDAVNAGIVVVVAAGNEGDEGSFEGNACNKSPASEPLAITVGASTISDQRVEWSNFGTCVDLLAPGVDIISAYYTSDSSAAVFDGTSMASPHVAGAAALLLQSSGSFAGTAASTELLSLASKNKLGNLNGSPNLLLYVSNIAPPCDDPPSEAYFVCKNRSGNTWAAHSSIATSNGGQLLSIRDQTMNDYVRNGFNENGKYWIGYNDIDSEAQFGWADGTCGDYENWTGGQPSNSGSSGEDCVEFLGPGQNGLWNDVTCNVNRWAFYQFPMSRYQNVCDEYDCKPGPGNSFSQTCGDSSTPAPTPAPVTSPSEPAFVCRTTSANNWEFHRSNAVSKKGHLLTIPDQIMNDYLGDEFANGKYWIGFNDLVTEGQWKWTDGSTSSYINWTGGQPSNSGSSGEDCAEFLGQSANGRWNDLTCSTNRWAFYQFPMSEYQNVCDKFDGCQPGPGNSFSETCGASAPSESTFVCRTTSSKNWEDHRSNAVSKNGHLLTISDQAMNDYLDDNFADGKYWIGYNDLVTEGQWKWTDGSTSSYVNWKSGQPNNSGGNPGEDCAEFLGQNENGWWNDLSCSTNRWAFYQFPLSEYQNVCADFGDDCLPGPGQSFCETCGEDPTFVCKVRSGNSWSDHSSRAQSDGGQLLTINDQAMNDYLLSEFPGNGKYWIGYNDIA